MKLSHHFVQRYLEQISEIGDYHLDGQEGRGWLMTATGHGSTGKEQLLGGRRPIANWRDQDNPVVGAVTR